MRTIANRVKHSLAFAGGVFFLLFLSVSCLDESPRDQLPEEKAYDSATNLYLNSVATLYNYIGGQADGEGLQGTIRGVYDLNTFTTDEAILPTRGGDWYDGGLWQSLYTHQWTESDEPFQNAWNYLYKVIVMCNRSLSNIDRHRSLLDETQRLAYEAEVRAVRAMYYFYLCDLFGRVPLVVSADVPVTEVQQSTRSEVFRFAFDELQAVAPLLPAERSNREGIYYGRVTRPVAWFLLAKLALNAEVLTDEQWTDDTRLSGETLMFEVDGTMLDAWQTCVAYCDSLARFGYQLESDYAANFAIHNEASSENIFTIPMDKMLYANQYCYLFRSRHYNHGGALGLGAENGTSATRSVMLTYGYGTGEVDCRMALPTPFGWTAGWSCSMMAVRWFTCLFRWRLTFQARLTRRRVAPAWLSTKWTAPPTATASCRRTTSSCSVMPTCCL